MKLPNPALITHMGDRTIRAPNATNRGDECAELDEINGGHHEKLLFRASRFDVGECGIGAIGGGRAGHRGE